ncbi:MULTISPECIES: cytochrome c oxidase subunit 4 [Actinoallomurus]|uniref:cytochrome c oxidase subunit 4 n=1 Tax=Actinoallomurus TaxID=667113 RepID=UPI002092B804|nr:MULTISPECIES: cytochrome c oxidase subunit 4 [Actinoallomurus]MCO5967081.1 cytochrome c oxidase subunit 4 [Actinoallomurus soli]MCO5996491.1 cytochrome c oxidase subunit 4 [Actinoallomurus rhizosphaericola]
MKIEGFLFVFCALFFAVMDLIYWLWSHDPTGTTALALTIGLAGLTGFYLLFTGRRIDPRPEDDKDADIAEGAGELGFFSPHSWWPLFTALAAATAALGAVFGWWLMLIGMLGVILAAIGFVFEYYRGHFSH